MTPIKFLFSFIVCLALSLHTAHAADITVAWKTIDDDTGKPRSIVRISESNGQFDGAIEKIFPEPNEAPNLKCDKCQGALKDQAVLGMTIIHQLKKHQEEYKDGTIMDPDNGKIYQCKLWMENGGKKLKVRGYIGPLFRTQTWLRAE